MDSPRLTRVHVRRVVPQPIRRYGGAEHRAAARCATHPRSWNAFLPDMAITTNRLVWGREQSKAQLEIRHEPGPNREWEAVRTRQWGPLRWNRYVGRWN
jgi:hypothetical protein